VTSGGNNITDFPDNQLTKFRSIYIWLIPDFFRLPLLKFLLSIALHSTIGWTPLTDTSNKQTDVSLCKFVFVVCLSVSDVEFDN